MGRADPNYDAREAVEKVLAALDSMATKTPNQGESKGEQAELYLALSYFDWWREQLWLNERRTMRA